MTLTLLLGLALGQYTPQEAQSVFVEGNDAYYRQDYDTAKARYTHLIEGGFGGADVLFNLGTTQLAEGSLGPAVVSLERARRLDDADDIEANLAIARKQQVDQVVGEESAVPFTWRLADAVNEHLVAGGFLASWWAALLCFVWWRQARTTLLPALLALGLFVGGAALGALTANHAWVRRSVVEAVVTASSVKVVEFPGPTAKTSFEAHAGLKVRIMESSGAYVRIRLPNAVEGWTTRDALTEL